MSGTVRAVNRPTSQSTSPARRLYGLTDQLQVQLRVLEEGLGPVHVRLMELEDADIEAVAFVVLMQAAKSAQEDLKAIMTGVKAINEAKEKTHKSFGKSPSLKGDYDFESTFQLMSTLWLMQLEAELDDIRGDMAETSEIDQLRLQILMDRVAKLMSTLSNMVKKCADTNSQIVRNLK